MVRLVREEKGQAVVELALVLSLLLLILLGILTFGLVMHDYLSVTYASREGARAAALGGSDAAVVDAVTTALPATLDPALVTTTITPAQGNRPRGATITVTVSYPIPLDIPFIASALGRDSLTLSGSTVMRAEVGG